MRAPGTAPPPFGSSAAKRSALTRAIEIAAAHIAQGSSVTHSVQSSSREVPSLTAAARIAAISACAVGSLDPRMALRVSATISSPLVTTAPTGTSPAAAASAARSSARRIGGGSGKLMLAPLADGSAQGIFALLGVGRCCCSLVPGGLLHLGGRHLHSRLLAADFHGASLDVERRRSTALSGDAVGSRRDRRRFGLACLVDVEKSRCDRGNDEHDRDDQGEDDGAQCRLPDRVP